MNASRPARPALATVICVYEVIGVAFSIGLRLLARQIRPAQIHPNPAQVHAIPLPPANPLIVPLYWVGTVLLLAAAVALWQMRRSAFFLLAAQFVLAVIVFLLGLPRLLLELRRLQSVYQGRPSGLYNPIPPWLLFGIPILSLVVAWTLRIAILWYVGVVTSRRNINPPIAAFDETGGLA